jgi:NAD(P)H-hydrate epimerase
MARDVIAIGPGLGHAPRTKEFIRQIVDRATAPLVLDADGLNAVAGTDVLRARPGPTVVTPHPGEMARLLASDTARVQADRLGAARTFARTENVIVVLKGARTIVASPDGGAAISPTGNPGMATGGTGDVLAGLLGGLLAQGLAPFDAAVLGVFAHGAAGDAIAARQGEVGLVAGDLLPELPPTLAGLQTAARPEAPARRGYRAGA